ncbi:MAG: hypothetical protein AB7F75_02180 [Planctomycetota bacterium]
MAQGPRFNSRGFILIIVIGLLGVLSYLALMLAQHASTSQRLGMQGLHQSKARLAARSAIDKAVVAVRMAGWNPASFQQFERKLECAGDDRNRDGLDSGGEDLASDGFSTITSLEDDLTPSMALAEDPLATAPRSLVLSIGGKDSGVSWMDDRQHPSVLSKVGLGMGCLDLNGGVESGEGREGQRYQDDFGLAYSASDPSHPFNEPTRLLLNAWGNYYKYRAMVRPNRTYDYSVQPDNPVNMMSSSGSAPNAYGNPAGRFDRFDPSQDLHLPSTEPGLGDRLMAARPTGGYRTLDLPTKILEELVAQWSDSSGLVCPSWRQADGSVIGNVPPQLLDEMRGEFSRIAQLQPARREEVMVIPGTDIPPLDPNDLAGDEFNNSYFEGPEGRSYLNMRFYTLRSAINDVNVAPLSVLAALCQSVRGVKYREYWPNTRDGVSDFCRENILRAPKENSHAISGSHPVAGDPLFSMTDCLKLVRDLDARRRLNPFANLKDLGDFLRRWSGSYDGRGQVYDNRTLASSWFPEFIDPYMGNARGYVLAYLLNPHVNSNHLVWDEAQVPSWNQGILSLGISHSPKYGYRDFSYKCLYDRFMPHQRGGSLTIGSEHHRIESLGYSLGSGGVVLGRVHIKAGVQSFRLLDIHVQKDFVKATSHPVTQSSSLGPYWVTYPELPGVTPADWDGQLALKPLPLSASPLYGDAKTMVLSLSGYEYGPTTPDPPSGWPVGPRNLVGPSQDPARGLFRNSLQPAPGDEIRSLVAGSYSEIEMASDLLPGGGIRVSPYNNTLSIGNSGSGGNFTNRREALLVLRNVLCDPPQDGPGDLIDLTVLPKALPSFHEGAVSFYFKPRFTCSKESTGLGSGNRTLLAIPFVVFDQETELTCLGQGLPSPLVQPEPYMRSWYTAMMRLCWGANENKESGRLDEVPAQWPWMMQYDNRNFYGQQGSGPHLFPNMTGLMDSSGLLGYVIQEIMPDNLAGMFDTANNWVPSGDGRPWHWSAPNPYAEERLQLEFIIAKYADVPYDTVTPALHSLENLNPTFHDSSFNPNPGFWYEDEMSLTATSGSYFQPEDKPLYLFDNSDLSQGVLGYHTVRKTFILSHPYNIQSGSLRGTGPRDSSGNHQALLSPGRWNHLFVTWRNLYDLLVCGDPHQGGCLAVYINGTFKKVSPMGFSMAGLFAMQDFSELYGEDLNAGPPSPWAPQQHDPYESSYSASKNPFQYYGLPQRVGASEEKLTAMHQQVPPLHYLTPDGNYLHNYDYCRYSVGPFSARNENLFLRFPPRIYFGFAPYTQRSYESPGVLNEDAPYAAGSMCWGAFMDIQIFEKPSWQICDVNGGFLSDLPQWHDFSPYANDTTSIPAVLYPMNLLSNKERAQTWSLAGVSWNAHLPEFHEFWDDQNNNPGPDIGDAQRLLCDINLGTSTLGMLRVSQVPGAGQSVPLWVGPQSLMVAGPTDLRLEIVFLGPKVTMSTPIIENFEVALAPKSPMFLSYEIE